MVLEAHEVEALGAQVFLAELHHGVGPAAGARIGEAHGLHGAEAQRVAAAARQFLDGQAGLEVRRRVLRDVRRRRLALEQRIHEALVLFAVERAVQVVVRAAGGLAVARSPEGDRGVHGFGVHDGADGVVEVEAPGAREPGDLLG